MRHVTSSEMNKIANESFLVIHLSSWEPVWIEVDGFTSLIHRTCLRK